MKTLIFVNGPMGVGKTAVCQKLLERLKPGMYLDGDWCWNINPFQVTNETRSMVLDNIVAILSRSLSCPELQYVIFGWVMHQPEIARTILGRIDLQDVNVRQYTLLCTEETLRYRIAKDIQAGVRNMDILERSLCYLSLYECQDTVKIMTDGQTPDEIAEQIVRLEASF